MSAKVAMGEVWLRWSGAYVTVLMLIAGFLRLRPITSAAFVGCGTLLAALVSHPSGQRRHLWLSVLASIGLGLFVGLWVSRFGPIWVSSGDERRRKRSSPTAYSAAATPELGRFLRSLSAALAQPAPITAVDDVLGTNERIGTDHSRDGTSRRADRRRRSNNSREPSGFRFRWCACTP